jgi:hypothetical protein
LADSDSTLQVSGGDYTSGQAWIDAKDGVTGTHTLNVEDNSFSGTVQLNNGTVIASAFIIKPQSGAKHDGRSRNVSGSGATLINTSSVIRWRTTNGATLTMEDMVIEQTAGANIALEQLNTSGAVTLTRCIFEKRGTATGKNIEANSTPDITMQDCIVYGHTSFGVDTRGTTTTDNIIGTTIIGGSVGLLPAGGGSIANNIVMNASSECYNADDLADTNHKSNIASDASAVTEWDGGGGGFNDVEFLETGDIPTKDYVAFVDKDTVGSEDYHLVDLEHGTYDNVALAGGAPSLGSGFDIDGDARDGSAPDIGADEVSAAAITVTPSALTLTLAQPVPTIDTGDVTVTPNVQALTLTQPALIIIGDVIVTPSTQTLTLSEQSPVIIGDVIITPSEQALTLSLPVPVIDITGDIVIMPSVQTLALAQEAPSVIGDVAITPSEQALSLALETPVISIVAGETFVASVLSLTLSQPVPTAITDAIITPNTQALTLSQPVPVVTIAVDVTVTPSALALSLAQAAPIIDLSIIVIVSGLTLSLTQATPIIDIVINAIVIPSTLALSLVALSPPFEELESLALSLIQGIPAISIDTTPEIAIQIISSISLHRPEISITDDIKIIVTNARTFAISEYTAMAFNSMARFNGKYLYAKADGIYEGGGDDDNGADIHASYKTGAFDINATEVQKLRNAFLNFRSNGDIQLFSVGNEINTRLYNITNSTADTMHERRQKFERGIRDNHFSFGISNVNGSSFEIKSAKILTEPIRKRR